ncbi:MAG: MarR family transcriptional regulator, partial [Clostridia bacterium]|nr:MarR family transcriptional regulator [Clostridia bacterium]
DENDQRSVRVYLTEEGQALNDRIHSEFYKVDMQLVEGFSEDEKQMIRRIFAKMNQNLEGMNL